MIQLNKTYITKPKGFKVTVTELSKDIPENEIKAFGEWIDRCVLEYPIGINHEYFSYDSDFSNDIEVLFYIEEIEVTILDDFIQFLKNTGREIKMANPKHKPGEGYSPPPYYSNINIESTMKKYLSQSK